MDPVSVQTFQFSGLETLLISLLVAVIACVTLFWRMSSRFVTHDECKRNHDGANSDDEQIRQLLEKMEKKMDDRDARMNTKHELLFRMMRAVILYMDLPAEKKTEILNMRPNRET